MVKAVAFISGALLGGTGAWGESLPLVAACLFLISFINIGMVLGIFPVAGISRSFFSYGGPSVK